MTINDDKHMILNPDLWLQWPFLPLKRKNNIGMKNMGIIMEDENNQKGIIVVYHCLLFMMPKTPAEWEKLDKTTYKSVDDLLQDGWMVD